MLTRKEALYYDEQLHPAFAGYLHDGTITERDTLAVIFHLLTKGILDPIWEDGSMLKKIVGARKTKRTSILPFNQFLVEKIFGSKDEVTTREIGNAIKNGEIEQAIKDNLHAITAFPIINEELKFTLGKHGRVNFSVNGNPVDTVEEGTAFRKLLYKLFLPIFLGVGVLLIIMYFIYTKFTPGDNFPYATHNFSVQVSGDGDPNTLLLTGGIFVAVILLVLFSFVFSKKTVSYNFKDKVIPIAKKKYDELYEFIKTHPLPKHRFINEFLAFSIAFGFDDTWHKDFGLDAEIKIDENPLMNST